MLADLKISGGAGNLVDLRLTEAGLAGRFLSRWAGFMPLRSGTPTRTPTERQPERVRRTTTVPSANPWWDHSLVWFLAALGLRQEIVTGLTLDPERRTPIAATMAAEDGSWAEVRLAADDAGRRLVRGGGDDLWAAVEHGYALWAELGEPGWEDFGLTVHEREQRLWFGDPDSPRTWLLPSC